MTIPVYTTGFLEIKNVVSMMLNMIKIEKVAKAIYVY